jgi:two-component system cell cycle sensor histidine kinase/response regulator CckA
MGQEQIHAHGQVRGGRAALTISGMPWEWLTTRGDLELYGLPSAAFWIRPSLQRLLGPLREEIGDDLYRLLVAYYSSLGTEEDYHAMITKLGSSFVEGFLAWGRAVSSAGWGRFSLPHCDPVRKQAVVRVDNPWELQMQGPEESWGCPFLQGKIIGIFTHAFGVTCWADEQAERRSEDGCAIEFRVAPSQRTIAVELEELRRRRQRERDGVLAREVEVKTSALCEAQERQRAMLSSLSDLVFTVDSALVIEQYLPPRDHAHDFPPRAEAAGRPLAEVFGGELTEALRLALEAEPVEPGSYDFAALVAGQAHAYDARYAPRHGPDGELEGLTLIVRDTTVQRRIEAQLRQSQKMESIGLLAGGIAHDFNNLLTAIVNAADLLAMQVRPELRELVTMILDASETASGLIRKLLDFSRQGQAQRTTLDAHAIVASTAQLLQRSVSANIEVSTQLDATRFHLRGDPNQLQSALLNLGVNARDAMPQGGEIVLSTRNLELGPADCKATSAELRPGSYLEISVRDTGEGMSEETLGRIFEPFFTTKGVGKGTGLGLPAVYGTMAEHHGDIEVDSELGRGTCFRLRLPITNKRELETDEARSHESGPACILLADDDALIRGMAEQQLRELGYEVLVTDDGAAALACFRDRHEDIDLVLLDIVMPNMSGHQAFRAIRDIDPDVPVVFASGFSREGAVGEDVQGFVNKPYRMSELAEAIRRALRG